MTYKSKTVRRWSLWVFSGTMVVLAAAGVAGSQERVSLEQILAGHRAGLGPAVQEQAVPPRTLHGMVRFTTLVGPSASLQGTVAVASQDKKLDLRLVFENSQYPGERFVFDGKQSFVDYITVGVRSRLGQFVHQQNQVLESGLFGGVLTAGWSLHGPLPEGVKLEYEGLKKKNDRTLHQVRYRNAKGGGDTEIRLFFDPETLRHVQTEYRVTRNPSISFSETNTARQQVARTTLEEEFSNFQTVQGLTLPARWRIRYTTEGGAAISGTSTTIMEWQVIFQNVDVNLPQDPALFIAKP